MTESKNVFRRYTDLASLLHMLRRGAITLLRPDTWDDRNDRLLMETYADRMKMKTLLALCLTSRGETYHHWKIFTDRNNGVCIHFRREELKRDMRAAGVRLEKVEYLRLHELDEDHAVEQLPFLKRFGYGDEGEYRAVYQNKNEEPVLKQIPIGPGTIERVTLNPWMAGPVFDAVREVIEAQRGDANFTVDHSSLIDNRRWRAFAEKYKKLQP